MTPDWNTFVLIPPRANMEDVNICCELSTTAFTVPTRTRPVESIFVFVNGADNVSLVTVPEFIIPSVVKYPI